MRDGRRGVAGAKPAPRRDCTGRRVLGAGVGFARPCQRGASCYGGAGYFGGASCYGGAGYFGVAGYF
eukprot:scaffold12024_cov142-Isochrysis_galbana.AAC.1